MYKRKHNYITGLYLVLYLLTCLLQTKAKPGLFICLFHRLVRLPALIPTQHPIIRQVRHLVVPPIPIRVRRQPALPTQHQVILPVRRQVAQTQPPLQPRRAPPLPHRRLLLLRAPLQLPPLRLPAVEARDPVSKPWPTPPGLIRKFSSNFPLNHRHLPHSA